VPGISGYEVVFKASEFQSFQPAAQARAICPVGKQVLGGGAAAERQVASTDMFVIDSSYPSPAFNLSRDGGVWTATARTQNFTSASENWRLSAFAICGYVTQ